MPHTYSQLHYHLVFGTKDRQPAIAAEWRERLWQYLAGTVKSERGHSRQIGGVADHVHLLVSLPPRLAIPDLLERLKANSSRWVHRLFPNAGFWWQAGYGAFTVSHSGLEAVARYIADQEEHHRTMTFEVEYRQLLRKHGIEFDERYLWG